MTFHANDGPGTPVRGGVKGKLEEAAECYLAHVVEGRSIRSIAQRTDVHPSTIMRRIRKIEAMRDDPVLDQYLSGATSRPAKLVTAKPKATNTDRGRVGLPERQLLRRLGETGAILVVSPGLKKAVVLRTNSAGEQTRTAVVEAELAGVCVLRDWIKLTRGGKVSCYEITEAGRMALRRALAADAAERQSGQMGFAEAPDAFGEQHKTWGERQVREGQDRQSLRVNLGESPVTMLARKKGPDGKPFLPTALIDAADRLREDFELAQMGPRVGQNWERFLTGGQRGAFGSSEAGLSGAQDRLSRAFAALGPGLGDIALRCCCFLEGLETAEKRMGWSARSGKIVLRIALQRLRHHYDTECHPDEHKIG